ncbi:MAG TPA: hypothetical protein PKO15_01290 [Fibrobacteria bacterium]|nr:hypothetical protein [Fibrobacteria bacterium]HOX49991.1 hypothetical protein [Fibrobacteria bacterium]
MPESIGPSQPPYSKLRDPALVDLDSFPNWKRNEKVSGRVHECLTRSSVARIVILRGVSSATPDVWRGAILRELDAATDFIEIEKPPKDYWLEAVLETNDRLCYKIQLSREVVRLTGQTFHGHFACERRSMD